MYIRKKMYFVIKVLIFNKIVGKSFIGIKNKEFIIVVEIFLIGIFIKFVY